MMRSMNMEDIIKNVEALAELNERACTLAESVLALHEDVADSMPGVFPREVAARIASLEQERSRLHGEMARLYRAIGGVH